MKTATVREVQHDLKKVLAWVDGGEEVQVTRRAKVVARLIPPEAARVKQPNFVARANAVWGSAPKGALVSQLVSEGRGER